MRTLTPAFSCINADKRVCKLNLVYQISTRLCKLDRVYKALLTTKNTRNKRQKLFPAKNFIQINNVFMYRSNWSFNIPPSRANPTHLTVHHAPGGGNLNVALEGWGIWTRFTSCSSKICTWVFSVFAFFSDFQDRISPYALKTVFKRSLKLSSWHISLWKAWTVFDWRRNFSLKRGISVLMGGAFERLFCHEGREFGQTNLQKFKCPGGGGCWIFNLPGT